ncbi:MAG TPA: ferredoxin [Mycobacteriales bacterium]|nr:ferredoxin [Mycobacteriales bacterium]
MGGTRVTVDRAECEANAVCVGIAPEVFELDDDEELHILVDAVPAELTERVRTAVDSCPKRALFLESAD